MPAWTITTFDSTIPLAEGAAPTATHAWREAIDAVLEQLAVTRADGCVMVVDGAPACLMPGHNVLGEIDLPATRAAAERMALTAIACELG